MRDDIGADAAGVSAGLEEPATGGADAAGGKGAGTLFGRRRRHRRGWGDVSRRRYAGEQLQHIVDDAAAGAGPLRATRLDAFVAKAEALFGRGRIPADHFNEVLIYGQGLGQDGDCTVILPNANEVRPGLTAVGGTTDMIATRHGSGFSEWWTGRLR
jgi:hypothetical protein